MNSNRKLLLANRAWVKERLGQFPDYFQSLAQDQRPDFLWIGCSDSRVPAEEITGANPGEIFVHRNIANMVHAEDLNVKCVLEYGIHQLKIKHIIVCGHYGCGGVRAAASGVDVGILNEWLDPIKKLNSKTNDTPIDRLVEQNVLSQIKSLSQNSSVQKAWNTRQILLIHGWVFDITTGLIKDLMTINSADDLVCWGQSPDCPQDPSLRSG